MKKSSTAEFRFYEELNRFLPPGKRKKSIPYTWKGRCRLVKALEAFGVPEEEVEVVLVNGESVGADHPLEDGDRVAVYPVFESLDISHLVRLREKPLRELRFVLDRDLEGLARCLEKQGLNARLLSPHQTASLDEVVRICEKTKCIFLTRRKAALRERRLTRVFWIRSSHPEDQLQEVLRRFHL